MTLQLVPRVGYVSVFPLLLRLLPADSPRLPSLLALVDAQLLSVFLSESLPSTPSSRKQKDAARNTRRPCRSARNLVKHHEAREHHK